MKQVSIKVFLIELVCKRKGTPLLKPLASVPFAPCPPFPSSLIRKREAESRAAHTVPAPLPCTPPSLQLLTGTAPSLAAHSSGEGNAARAAKEDKRGECFVHCCSHTAQDAVSAQLGRAVGSQVLCASVTGSCLAWDFFSLRCSD